MGWNELEDEDREGFETQRKRQKGYDPFSDEPTPLAVRRKRFVELLYSTC